MMTLLAPIKEEYLAKMLRAAGQLDDALKAVDESTFQANKARFSAYTVKANILSDMQQFEEAKALFTFN